MFPLSLLALKYSYFRRGRKKSVTAADRGEEERETEKKKRIQAREAERRETDGVRRESEEINERGNRAGGAGVRRPESGAATDVLL